jgi:MoxR-like ATPase
MLREPQPSGPSKSIPTDGDPAESAAGPRPVGGLSHPAVFVAPDMADQPKLECSDRPPADGGQLDVDPAQIVERVKRVFSDLERDLVGFRPLLIQTVYALLTRENLLIFSPSGTAKTLYATAVFSRIRGARVFDTQMSKGTLAEELFGSIDTEQLKRGRIVHNTRDTLVDADLAFIDEFFDANDMVLRALLGVFNERVFKKGSQLEPSPLHTGIAAANYLRATEVTEAVLDRFLFRAYITPDYSPLTLLGIDHAFARNYGRQAAPPAGQQVPLDHLSLLADIVRGSCSNRQIVASPHILFLKNMVLNRYRELIGEASQSASKRPLYISPRTYAKARIVLNAAALLRGRTEVAAEDLSQLKYCVTTIGGREEQSQCFDKAYHEALLRIRAADWEHIDNLMAARDLAEQVMARATDGEAIANSSFLKRLLHFFGLVSEGELTFDHVRRYVDAIQPLDEQVKALKLGILRRIQELTRRIDRREDEHFA